MYRLFVGIDLPRHVKEQLTRISCGVPGARWLAPDQMHLTLRFVGEVDGGVFDDVLNALDTVQAPTFELSLKGVGHFPPRGKPETLWVGVSKSEQLTLLHGRVEAALSRIGLERDPRKFAPHVAIARLRDTNTSRLGQYLIEYNLYESERFVVDEFLLYSSMLSSSGAIYRVEAAYPLSGSNSDEALP